MKLDSFAKINLYLSVYPKRQDNYHGINTIFERISLKDTIILRGRKDGQIKVSTNNKKLAGDQSNFVWQAVELLRKKFKITQGLNIRIIKRVPLGSGMGGGSSNAASVFLGLNEFWKLGLSTRQLAGLGSKIGSDVPFFIYDCPFAVGRGRGEKITPLENFRNIKLWQVIVVPRINVSTALIYRKWDEFKSLGLTVSKSNVRVVSLAIKDNNFPLLTKVVFNSLELVTESLFPEVRKVKEKLFACGARLVMMSGSGPAVFCLVPSKNEAVLLSRRIKKENSYWGVFTAETC